MLLFLMLPRSSGERGGGAVMSIIDQPVFFLRLSLTTHKYPFNNLTSLRAEQIRNLKKLKKKKTGAVANAMI